MIRGARVLAILVLALLLAPIARGDVSHVHADLLANVSSIASGKPFLLGVRLTIDPGWHVYWKNPGDAGMATRVKFTAPPGFVVGDLQFPTPQRFDQAGDIVAFGYEDSVFLLAQVTPPAGPLPENNQFSAAVSWLVCSTVCIPGKQTADLDIASADAATPANAALFDRWTAQLPVAATASPEISGIHASGALQPDGDHASGAISIDITWKHPAPDVLQFISGALDQYNITQVKTTADGSVTHIAFHIETLAGQKPLPATLEAVAGYKDKDGNRRGIAFTISLPDASASNSQ